MDIVTKQCNRCGVEKPATTEYFNISKKNDDGLQHRCKECNHIYKIKRALDFAPEALQYKNNVTLKICTKCGIEKPATIEFFYVDKRHRSGLQCWCKECHRAYYVQRRFDSVCCKRINTYNNKCALDFVSGIIPHDATAIVKTCSTCNVEKLATTEFFGVNNRNKDGLSYRCKECDAKQRLDLGHRERQRVYQLRYMTDPEVCIKHSIRSRNYQKTDKGRAVTNLVKQKRRTLKLLLPNTFTTDEWQRCLSYWDNKCVYCGSTDKPTMDHFIPLISKNELCPGTVKENIVLACRHCNSLKHNKSPYTWATKEALERIETYFASLANLEETTL